MGFTDPWKAAYTRGPFEPENTMIEAPPAAPALEALRRELDEVDDALLALLAKRLALTGQVKSFKQVTVKSPTSPLRPGREAHIHRRLLLAAKNQNVDPHLALRLWRTILTDSSLGQAPMTLHISKRLSQTLGHRLRLRDHFPGMPVEEWRDEAQALMQVNANPGDICAVETDAPWIDACVAGKAGTAQIIAALPVIKVEAAPQLLIFGNALTEATGHDETLLITQGNLPRDFALQPLWQTKSGPWRLSALAGYHSEQESPLVGLTRSNISLGLKLAGRYPSAIEV
jgi:chorismate mutase / prephenate dehydratase